MVYQKKRSKTEQAIKDTIFTLMENQPIQKISTSQICQLAKINRTTFYRHFLDKYEVLEKSESDFFTSLAEVFEQAKLEERDGIKEWRNHLFLKLFERIDDNNIYLKRILSTYGDIGFQKRFILQIQEISSYLVKDTIGKNIATFEEDLLLHHVGYGIFSLLQFYLDHPQTKPLQLMETYQNLIERKA